MNAADEPGASVEGPVGRMPPQDWMRMPETRQVVTALTREGTEVRYVGGCVRDAVAGRPVRDIDIATPDPPEKVMELLRAARIQVVPTGIEHGTVTAVVGGRPFEVTTLRHDVETDGRRARVAFTDDWVADAARRDFTINALSCTPDGRLYDPFGGLRDLEAGVIRFVGEPRRRIEEDVLRLLRFFRFHASFGMPPPHAESLEACVAMAGRLRTLSGERVRSELLRLLTAPAAVEVVRLMLERGVLADLLPEVRDVERLAGLGAAETRARAAPDAVLRLVALLQTDAGGAASVADRLRMSRAERARMTSLVQRRNAELGSTVAEVRRAIYENGRGRYRDLCLLQAAGDADLAALERRWIQAAEWTPPLFPLAGADVLAFGVSRGPAVGALLAKVERWWVGRGFVDDRAACLRRLEIAARSRCPS